MTTPGLPLPETPLPILLHLGAIDVDPRKERVSIELSMIETGHEALPGEFHRWKLTDRLEIAARCEPSLSRPARPPLRLFRG